MRTVAKDWLENGKDHSFYLIGTNDERRSYYPAIIGVAKDLSHVAYSFERLCECFMDKNNWDWDIATEWVIYDVERALPYYGERAPVILPNNFLSSRNKTYDPVKVEGARNGKM
jgi:hypothetical protein